MRIVLAGLALTLSFLGIANAQPQHPPPECRRQGNERVDWQACLDVTPREAPWRSLVLINLGTDAFLRRDYASAVRHYDEAAPSGRRTLYSDVNFHAFRGAAYWHVGRRDEARSDADIAWRMLHNDPALPIPSTVYFPAATDREMIYVYLLPIWQAGDNNRFQLALQEFRDLPAFDWLSFSNRSAVLSQIGDNSGALGLSERALALAPNEAAALNNHCYILYQLRRHAEALPYCERAVALAPREAAVQDSVSDVYAALGRCEEAIRANAEAQRLDPSNPGYREQIACSES